ncbi:MAG: thiol:disulfide interchange protein DsbA/DsbL [Xanthomonadales bacterium]|nr:thiol:disulfide interchange protein DsbA/DsbL [Gammaproteobacteria bacterium]MBT8052852.1 thiol:disulfide interchange protein DsbA/DsbL [Gammaproteobacteria bacterium]NND55687.1 thiol:disulfide interchange protein DsbA/DsbL [Xanthomonadales bacterium]NNK49998.1 thiol:disulfide interchange protein DsbA/DsbL [Xanthomonadales bacterium]
MKNSVIRLLMALTAATLFLTPAAQAQAEKPVPYQEGLHYFLIEGAPAVTGDTIKLEEAFSYLCTHCNTFDPYLENWKKRKPDYVEFRRIPVVFGRESWELYARGYVTAQMMDVSEQAHSALMDRIWKEKNMIRSMDELATFYSQFDLDKEKFLSTSRSFAVDGKLRKDQLLVQAYGIRGTPSLVLNGKYRIAGSAAVASYDVMFDIVDYLIAQEAKGRVSQQASAATD